MKITFLGGAKLEFLSNRDLSISKGAGQAHLPELRASLTWTLHLDLKGLSTKLTTIN
jgi:hypothetical protein